MSFFDSLFMADMTAAGKNITACHFQIIVNGFQPVFHIERAFGVQRQNVGLYLKEVIKNGSVVSNRLVNIGNGRQGYERVYEYKGNYYTMTGIGTNGFIVSAYPFRKDDL